MISESKKLFFKSAFLVLEDEKIPEVIKSGKYSSIVAISHKDFNLEKFKKKVKTTALINLKQSEEEIFAKFNDTTRNEIRKTYKLPDLKFVSVDKNFSAAFALYKNFEYAQNRVPFSKSRLENCLVFSAYLGSEIISGIFVDQGEKDLRIRYIFSKRLKIDDKDLYRMIAYATRRLMWEICLYGKKNGSGFLDLASVNFKNPDVANITKFKMSFGGEVANEYTYTYKSAVYSVFEKIVVIKNSIKKIFKI